MSVAKSQQQETKTQTVFHMDLGLLYKNIRIHNRVNIVMESNFRTKVKMKTYNKYAHYVFIIDVFKNCLLFPCKCSLFFERGIVEGVRVYW